MCDWCAARTASWRSHSRRARRKRWCTIFSASLTGWTGKRWIVVVSKEEGAPTMRAQADAQQAEIERGVQSDPLVQAVLNRFPGAKIVGVTQNVPDVGEGAGRLAGDRGRARVPEKRRSVVRKDYAQKEIDRWRTSWA